MKLILPTLAILTAIISTGCIQTGVFVKSEMLSRPSGTPFVIAANYISLAHYFDDHAKKYGPLTTGVLTINESEGKADITMGNGPYYGMIELKRIDDNSTLITGYSWYGSHERIREWEGFLRTYPNHNSSQPLK